MFRRPKITKTLAYQVFTVFIAGMLLVDIVSFFVLKSLSYNSILEEKEKLTQGIVRDAYRYITEYDSYMWVMEYLLNHQDEDLDLEYDTSIATNRKLDALMSNHEGLNIKTVRPDDLEYFSDEDQKAFAEIVYNRWLLRFNGLKESYDIDFLYIFESDDNYNEVNFIISGSDGKLRRGKNPGEAYVFGTKVVTSEAQYTSFRDLKKDISKFVYTSEYLDAYRYLFKLDKHNFVIGMTFNIKDINSSVFYQTLKILFAFIILQSFLLVFCRFLLAECAIKPIEEVAKNVNEYTKTKDARKVKTQLSLIKAENEIGSLSHGIDEMIGEIESYLKEIKDVTAENERISVELNLAQKIQADMLPSTFPAFPGIKQFDVYASMDPAKEVGGDFYDFFMADDDHVVLVIADVSGKGVPASLFMAIAKALIKNRELLGGTLSEVLRDVNQQLSEGNEEGMFVTVWMAVVNIHTGKGYAANAGHEHPVLRHKDGSYELVKYRHSMAIAMMPGVSYEDHEIQLRPGDRIFVYTDGLPEARRGDGEFYGTDRLINALNSEPNAEARKTIDNVTADMNSFVAGAEQFDDVTMLVFDFYGDEFDGAKETKE